MYLSYKSPERKVELSVVGRQFFNDIYAFHEVVRSR